MILHNDRKAFEEIIHKVYNYEAISPDFVQ